MSTYYFSEKENNNLLTSVNQVPEIFQKTETSGMKRLAEADKVCQEMFLKKNYLTKTIPGRFNNRLLICL